MTKINLFGENCKGTCLWTHVFQWYFLTSWTRQSWGPFSRSNHMSTTSMTFWNHHINFYQTYSVTDGIMYINLISTYYSAHSQMLVPINILSTVTKEQFTLWVWTYFGRRNHSSRRRQTLSPHGHSGKTRNLIICSEQWTMVTRFSSEATACKPCHKCLYEVPAAESCTCTLKCSLMSCKPVPLVYIRQPYRCIQFWGIRSLQF
jgi:hypothetical protein